MLEAGSLGLDGYLVKPVSPSLLYDTIMTALGYKSVGQAQARKTAGLPSVESIRGARLLVVEDNEINRQVARGILEGNGFIVDMADNGRLAVEAVQNNPYDAVLMDINMPIMDGYSACKKIRKDEKFEKLPIIAMTANAMTGDREKALAAGMNSHVAKPIDVKDLLSVLRKWVKPANERTAKDGDAPAASDRSGTPQQKLGPLPGMNIEEGLARLAGDIGLYREILYKFAASHADADTRITKVIKGMDLNNPDTGRKDLETAQRLAHTAKGVSGNIGAGLLFDAASRLEGALKDEDIDQALLVLPKFSDCLDTVIKGINALKEDETAAKIHTGHQGDTESIRALLVTLQGMLEDDDTTAGSVVRQLEGAILGDGQKDLFDQLSRQIGGYDFEAAGQTLKVLGRKLNITLG